MILAFTKAVLMLYAFCLNKTNKDFPHGPSCVTGSGPQAAAFQKICFKNKITFKAN